MPNPMFGNNTSPNGATAPNDSLNDSYKRYRRGYNQFNLTRPFYNTERYADINLVEVLEGVEGDRLRFGNKHDIRTYTLKSPVMFDLYKKKTYFMVDNKAILPNNWDKVYKQPNKGDDVVPDVNCVSKILYDVWNFLNYNIKNNSDSIPRTHDGFNYIMRCILLLESIFSNGSLLASMNAHLSSMLVVLDDDGNNTNKSFDQWLEDLYNTHINSFYVTIPSLSTKKFTFVDTESDDYITVTPSHLFDLMRTYPDFDLQFDPGNTFFLATFEEIIDSLKLLRFRLDISSGDVLEQISLNLSRLVAYQLVCAQFYTRDSVDNIYNAESFIDNAKSTVNTLISRLYVGTSSTNTLFWPRFEYNGTYYDLDVFSGAVIDKLAGSFFNGYIFNNAGLTYTDMLSAYYYFHSLFFYRKSLRYGDYFVGAKTLPYAPSDVTADVVSNSVSALDMTRSILMQRFANAVERVSNTWKDYISGVMDGVAPPNPYEPRFLASSTSKVGGFEVENTAENQGNIVTILRSANSNYVYELEVGEPCIVIGVSTYEIPRVYSRTVDRFFKHFDRFDMFNKFMQNIGDQEISMGERSSAFSPSRIFGYTPRHMEYKQRYPIASGGFVENLNGYAFITDNNQSGQNDIDFSDNGLHISSNYIRNKNSEMDRFYSSLTGVTLSSYFHFICKYDLICNASRQMEYSPSIL